MSDPSCAAKSSQAVATAENSLSVGNGQGLKGKESEYCNSRSVNRSPDSKKQDSSSFNSCQAKGRQQKVNGVSKSKQVQPKDIDCSSFYNKGLFMNLREIFFPWHDYNAMIKKSSFNNNSFKSLSFSNRKKNR